MTFERAEVIVPCEDLAATLAFFTDRLGFRLESIRPADDPRAAVISGYGVRLRLERGPGAAGTLRLVARESSPPLVAPNGMRIVIEGPDALPVARPTFVLSRAKDARWIIGRAGMRYRDLVPDRQGGFLVASQIRIEDGGEVPDYVHYHAVRFQMIHCVAGWVRLVYEGQGDSFVLRAGECVLQPPRIRHRVLECSPGLEVVEVGSPADHETFADHALALPGGEDRVWSGQRFVRGDPSCIAEATNGLASARIVASGSFASTKLTFAFVLAGTATLRAGDRAREPLEKADAFVIPPAMPWSLDACDALELLEVTL
jgi:quercetin dioxygenase-like cupin family protein